MGDWNCSMFCCTLLYVHSSFAIILIGKRELVAFLGLSYWFLVMVVWLFLAVPWVCQRFVIVGTLVDIARLAKRFNMRSQSPAWLTGYQKARTWYSIYRLTHWFTLQVSDYDVKIDDCVDSVSSATSCKTCNVIMT